MSESIDRIGVIFAVALAGVLAFAQPSWAAERIQLETRAPSAGLLAANDENQAARTPEQNDAARTEPDRVEERISDLHEKLHITPDQETEWKSVAQIMRDNAKDVRSTIDEKNQNQESMTAVDDLRVYQKRAQAHVEGLGRLIPAFDALYAKMSYEQKKNADTIFSGHQAEHSSN